MHGNGKVTGSDILQVLRDLSGSFLTDEQRQVRPLISRSHSAISAGNGLLSSGSSSLFNAVNALVLDIF